MQDILTDPDQQPKLASIFRRWAACFIDLFLVLIVSAIIAVIFGERQLYPDGSYRSYTFHKINGNLVLLLCWLVFLPGIEIFNNGQTIGKILLRLRTLHEDGSRLNWKRCLVKHLFDFVDHFPGCGITGMIVSGITRKKQRVGDLVAKTVVIDSIPKSG
ncbi:RDD family protein [Longitalea luteola]|uniref:RDD family protein n=1 Tax=Longitalea luteola TaxID=2812563 RepID=UPI001A966D4A|nr:RDD family protein [Longitalea luteola]